MEAYDGDLKKPRVLHCGHTICEDCLRGIWHHQCCPICKRPFSVGKPDEYEINYTVKHLIEEKNMQIRGGFTPTVGMTPPGSI